MRGRRLGVTLLVVGLAAAGFAAESGSAQTPSPVPGPTISPGAGAARVPDPDCTVAGTDGDDVLQGTDGPDVICGLGGNDDLRGLGGDDDLRGGAGDDLLAGGPGNDLLAGGEGSDTASYLASATGVAVDLAAGVATGEGADGLSGIERVVGSAWNDVLRGTGGPDVLLGGGGTDLLFGLEGDDLLDGGTGSDYLAGDSGLDDLRGGPGADICNQMPDLGTTSDCSGPHPRDGNDVRGPLDVRRVRTGLDRSRPIWRIAMRSRWSTRGIWDRGYAVILLDTRGDAAPDHYVVARSTGRRFSATLFRVRPKGRDRQMRGGAKAWRPNQRSVTVRVALRRLGLDPARQYFGWGVKTLFTGSGCRRVCLDPVPSQELYVQPVRR